MVVVEVGRRDARAHVSLGGRHEVTYLGAMVGRPGYDELVAQRGRAIADEIVADAQWYSDAAHQRWDVSLTRSDVAPFTELAAAIPIRTTVRRDSLAAVNDALLDLSDGPVFGAAVLVVGIEPRPAGVDNADDGRPDRLDLPLETLATDAIDQRSATRRPRGGTTGWPRAGHRLRS